MFRISRENCVGTFLSMKQNYEIEASNGGRISLLYYTVQEMVPAFRRTLI